jgi:hypothetical protein
MPEEKDLGWIAGIIDGEGTIRIYRTKVYLSKTDTTELRYFCQVQISNCDLRIIRKCVEIFVSLGLEYGNRVQNREKWRNIKKITPCYQLRLTKHSSVRKFLEIITPHLVGKQDKAWLVLEFVKHRFDGVNRSGSRRLFDRAADAALYNKQEFGMHARKVM